MKMTDDKIRSVMRLFSESELSIQGTLISGDVVDIWVSEDIFYAKMYRKKRIAFKTFDKLIDWLQTYDPNNE